jgi:tRNA(Ile)-lysidine synthase
VSLAPLPPTVGDALLGQRVAAAVSGGADSVALAWWLHNFATRPAPVITLVGLIHVNHGLRGAASDADQQWCRQLAGQLGVPIDITTALVDVRPGRSPESAARRARYAAFGEAAGRLGATVVCTAHTADDQAETVLLRLLRGAGLRGVSGIRAGQPGVVRPLLDCRRADLRAFLRHRGHTWCEDASNNDVSIPRNLVRHELLPVIERVAEGGVDALARFAAYAADDERWLEQAAATQVPAARAPDGTVVFDRIVLTGAPPPLARRAIRRAAEAVSPETPWSSVHIEAVRRLAGRVEGGGTLELPGILVRRVSNEMRFVPVRTSQGNLP